MNSLKLPLLLLALLTAQHTHAQGVLEEGDISPNLVFDVHRSVSQFNLYSREGYLIVLDFFAYWCPPCAFASPELEQGIQQYYEARGGTANGIPVLVVSVNVEPENFTLSETFINDNNLSFVVEDFDLQAFNQFSLGVMPRFVIINGLSNAAGLEQWEILHNSSNYTGPFFIPDFREILESVTIAAPDLPAWAENAMRGRTDMEYVLEWFGSFNFTSAEGWIHYAEMDRFLYPYASDSSNINFYDLDYGWFWTSMTHFPHLYSYEFETWVYYSVGSSQPRWFYDYRTNRWSAELRP